MADPVIPTFAKKGSTAQKTYVWVTDSKGNYTKVEASTAKKSFATLGADALVNLSQFLIATNVAPTTTSLKSLWDKMVDGAVVQYKAGKKSSPLDVLQVAIKNTPINTGVVSTYIKDYDPVTANAYLNNVALSIGFDVNGLSPEEKTDFAAKIKEAAGSSGKQSTKVINPVTGATETTIVPDTFDPKLFTENWLWSKVNLADVTKMPAKAITALTSVRQVLRGYGIDHLSPMEVNKLGVDLASGKTSVAAIQAQFLPEAIKNYPLLADRLKSNPEASVMDLLSPAISAIAKWLEIDPNSVDLTNPYLDKYARPDGLAGKAPMPSMADFINTLKMSPDAEKTTWANEAARGAATGLARAMGFGI
jgi:hypothetical protein